MIVKAYNSHSKDGVTHAIRDDDKNTVGLIEQRHGDQISAYARGCGTKNGFPSHRKALDWIQKKLKCHTLYLAGERKS